MDTVEDTWLLKQLLHHYSTVGYCSAVYYGAVFTETESTPSNPKICYSQQQKIHSR
jgi:hypothetical protein